MPVLDLTGRRFARLVVKRRTANDGQGNACWLCVCDCGNEKIVRGGHLRDGNNLACGCLKGNFVDLTGQRFARLTAVECVSRGKPTTWKCFCSCGNSTIVEASNLRNGKTKSCGCLVHEKCRLMGEANTVHGLSYTPEYRAYISAKHRCTNPEARVYPAYGGRGIEFRFTSLKEFVKHIGPRPSSRHSLDRIDNDGHYESGNVRWATRTQQQQNRRPFSRWSFAAQAA